MATASTTTGSPKPRYDWYQTNTDVVIAIMIRGLLPENVKVEFTENSVQFCYKHNDQPEEQFNFKLAKKIKPADSKFKVMSTKVELTMKKFEFGHWIHANIQPDEDKIQARVQPLAALNKELEGKQIEIESSTTSGSRQKNWDAIIKDETTKDPELDKAQTVDDLFREIYGGSDENARRAMMKSFTESNGTVLSTDWKDVSRKHVDIQPPTGMEFKKWNE